MAAILAANRQSEGEDGCYRENSRKFCSVGGVRPKKTAFFAFLWYLRLSCAQPTENSFTPNQWYRWKAETLEVCLLLVWRVCDQVFGRYRPLKGVEKWSRDHHQNGNLHTDTRRKFTDSKNAILFDLTKNNEVIAEKPFQNSGVTRRLLVIIIIITEIILLKCR